MDNAMFKTIPLDTAQEYFADASKKGEDRGRFLEQQRIVSLLKKQGMYNAVLLIKHNNETRT
jgi:uncharacterized membrane protein